MGLKMPERDCRVCGSNEVYPMFSLGEQPLANGLLECQDQESPIYPLQLDKCNHCSLIQLSHVVPKEKMFNNYLYIPSVSKTNLAHFDRIACLTTDRLGLINDDLIVDIGSNDGSLLQAFKRRGMRTVGIEPANNLAKIARDKGIDTLNNYFNQKAAKRVVDRYGNAKLVTAINVFAHIDDLHGFVRGLDTLLDYDGVFFAQFPDVRNLLKENQFDTIYHEHLSYFTYEPLHHLFSNTNFELENFTSDNVHGGSMQIWVRRRPNLLADFLEGVEDIKYNLVQRLEEEKKQGRKIVGFGAAAKGTVLLNYCGLGRDIIDYIADGTPYKQNKFIPGVKIPIYPEEHLLEDPPNTVLILAWNFKDEIINKLKGRGYDFIVPIPKVEVISG